MNTKRTLLLTSIVFFCAILIPAGLIKLTYSADTQERDVEILVLEGLKGVSVEVIQPVSGFEDKPSFNPVKVAELHTTVERLLSESDIKVLDDTSDGPDIGHVAVTINTWKAGPAINFIVQVEVELYQPTTLTRDTRFQILTPTWPLGAKVADSRKPVVVTHHEIAPTVRNEIETQLKMLIGDYLEANPLPEPKPDISGMMTGTIRYSSDEGGHYFIFADNGVIYNPLNLPEQYKRHGLRVAFRSVRNEHVSSTSFGVCIKLTMIFKL